MSKDKNTEIMELARELCGEGEQHQDCFHCPTLRCCGVQKFARELYGKRWRKQSEGEWKDCFNGKYANPTYMCSICGKGTLLKPDINELGNMEMTQALSPYCPNCGAKMKGENNDLDV